MKRNILATEIKAAEDLAFDSRIPYHKLPRLAKLIIEARTTGISKYISRRGCEPIDPDAFVNSCLTHGITNAIKVVH